MKKLILLIGMISLILISCTPTEPTTPGTERAILVLNNNHSESLFYKISDGGVNDDVEYSLSANSSITMYWGVDHDVFIEEDGNIQITYYLNNGEGGVINHQLVIGIQTSFSFGDEGEDLVVQNNTQGEVILLAIDGFTGQYFIGANSEISFDYDISHDYEIEMEYTGDHVFTGYDSIILSPFVTNEYEIEADAGALRIFNSNPITEISEIYISASSSSSWGPNQLDFNLSSGGWGLWTVDEGLWDIQVVDEYGGVTEFFGNYVNLDETFDVTFRNGSAKSRSAKSHDDTINKDRVEFKRSN